MQTVITADELLETSDGSLVVSPVLVFNLGKYKIQKSKMKQRCEVRVKSKDLGASKSLRYFLSVTHFILSITKEVRSSFPFRLKEKVHFQR